jgi:hypothetical protein
VLGGLAVGALPSAAVAASAGVNPAVAAVAFSNVAVTEINGTDAVDVTATITADDNPLDYEFVSLYVKSPTSPAFEYYGEAQSNEVGGLTFYVDGQNASDDVFAGAPITFKLQHDVTPTGSLGAATIDWTPPPTTLTIKAPHVVDFRHEVQVTGSLAYGAGGPLPVATPVVLQARAQGSANWSTIDTDSVGDRGKIVFEVDSPRHDGDLRVVYVSSSPGSASAVSDLAAVEVRPAVGLVVSPSAVPPGSRVQVSVAVAPRSTAGSITLQRKGKSGWRTVTRGGLNRNSRRTVSIKAGKRPKATSYRVRRGPTTLNTAGTSATKTLTVERHAGGSAKDHTFLYRINGNPVRWDPCRAVHYRVDLDEAPRGALADVKETLRRISQPTRIQFRYDGRTHYIPGSSASQTGPLVIAWAKPTETTLPLGGGTLGEGGGTYTYGTGEKPHITTGYAVLDATAHLAPGFGAGQTEGALLMHEIGHAVGLDHARHASQIMYPLLGPHAATMYGAGDYRGLQLLGRSQGCLS